MAAFTLVDGLGVAGGAIVAIAVVWVLLRPRRPLHVVVTLRREDAGEPEGEPPEKSPET